MKYLSLLLFCISCSSNVKHIYYPSKGKCVRIKCSHSLFQCHQLARKECKYGYDVIHSHGGLEVVEGSFVRSNGFLIVKCK